MEIRKHKTLIWITIFAISMGIFEGAVVVYLRALYYPNGFNFPLVPFDNFIAITELTRELASLFMLLSVGIIAGKNFTQRFSWFIYSFAIWDIIYYVFLYAILGWPESLLTWDILFLIPITWTGPVIAPILLSLLMILLALIIYHFNQKANKKVIITKQVWTLLISGSLIVFISFIWDYCKFLFKYISIEEIKGKQFSDKLFDMSVQYIPESFNWIFFIVGTSIIIFGILSFYKKLSKQH